MTISCVEDYDDTQFDCFSEIKYSILHDILLRHVDATDTRELILMYKDKLTFTILISFCRSVLFFTN